MNFSGLKTKIFAGIAVPLAFMLGLGILSLSRIDAMQETNKWVDHTHVVNEKADHIIANAMDMETGMRGFLLAGKDDFLKPYNAGKQASYANIAELQGIISDNPAQVQRLGEAAQILRDWQDQVAEKNIALRREIGDAETMNDLARLVQQEKGKQYFDKFREHIALFISRQEELLNQRNQESLATEQKLRVELSKAGEFESAALGLLDTLEDDHKAVDHTYQAIRQANAILTSAMNMETGVRGYLLAGREQFLQPYEQGAQRFLELTDELKKTVRDNPARVELLGETERVIKKWQVEVVNPMIELRRRIGDAKTMEDMADLVGKAEGKVFFDKFRGVMQQFMAEEQVLMKQRQNANAASVTQTKFIVVAALFVAFVVAGIFGTYVAVSVLRQVGGEPREISEIAEQVAEGRLDLQFGANPTGIHAALVSMTERLRKTVTGVREVSESMANSSEEMSSAAQSLSQGATEQAASLEQTTASMEELAASTQQNMENAHQTESMARQASTDADEGREAVEQAIEALRQIVGKITVVEEISNRINLLALNAAIEAARAGEHGKGFAVVASEVRKLAEHSHTAAKEISELSSSSLGLGEDAGNLIHRMVESFGKTSVLVQEITVASNEQSGGISQINQSLQQLEQVTQRNAGAAEEMAGTSEELSSRAMQLKQTMAFFKI